MDWHWQGFFILLEDNAIGRWVRESPSMLAFPTIIALHAVGMGLLVGGSAAIDFRILGYARGVPISSLERFVGIMRFGFWLNAISGLMLLLAYPTKALTNPIFFVKLLLIALAMVYGVLIRKMIIQKSIAETMRVPTKGKLLAGASLALWAGAVVSGRLLAYTYTYLDASFDNIVSLLGN
jgi:hypothetical protein